MRKLLFVILSVILTGGLIYSSCSNPATTIAPAATTSPAKTTTQAATTTPAKTTATATTTAPATIQPDSTRAVPQYQGK
jgi:hypothetical protein